MGTIDIPDNKELKEKNLAVVVSARQFIAPRQEGVDFQIMSAEEHEKASELFLQICTREKGIIEFYKKTKEDAHSTHAFICSLEKEELDPIVKAKSFFNKLIGSWRLKEQKRIEEENARLRKEAQDKADAEKRALERQQEEERLQMAQEAASRGDMKAADEILEAPIYIAPIIPNVTSIHQAQKVKGVSSRKNLKHRILDEELIVNILLDYIPDEHRNSAAKLLHYMTLDPAKIRKEIAYRGSEVSIPGVEIFEEMNISSRIG